jgi:hypothetical protein
MVRLRLEFGKPSIFCCNEATRALMSASISSESPNKPLQRSGMDKVLAAGEEVLC